jgi:hypothetical protein
LDIIIFDFKIAVFLSMLLFMPVSSRSVLTSGWNFSPDNSDTAGGTDRTRQKRRAVDTTRGRRRAGQRQEELAAGDASSSPFLVLVLVIGQ